MGMESLKLMMRLQLQKYESNKKRWAFEMLKNNVNMQNLVDEIQTVRCRLSDQLMPFEQSKSVNNNDLTKSPEVIQANNTSPMRQTTGNKEPGQRISRT